MITTGKIKTISKDGTVFSVRVPIFEAAGSTDECVLDCNLCYMPGCLNAYAVDDIVYISFIDNSLSHPVIIGKIYTGKEEKATTFGSFDSLAITSKAQLPKNTSFGDIPLKEILDLAGEIEILKEKVKTLESK
jgi:hypothetical protein